MKKLLLLLVIAMFALNIKAQTTVDIDTSKIYPNAEKQPEFPGGMDKFQQYVIQNCKPYPDESHLFVGGHPYITFIVGKDGSLSHIKISQGIDPYTDSEVLKAVKLSPKWRPGTENGIPVRVRYNIMVDLPEREYVSGEPVLKAKENAIYNAVDKEPEYPGGKDKLDLFIKNNLKYPPYAYQNNIQGKVFVTFVVEKNGRLTDIHSLRSPSEELAKEAVRLVHKSSKWVPGENNNKPVRTQFTVPIEFKL